MCIYKVKTMFLKIPHWGLGNSTERPKISRLRCTCKGNRKN